MNQEKIGKYIKEKRKSKNITQQELAKKLGVTDKAISKWENGRCLMDISFLKSLSDILDVSILEILNGEDSKSDTLEKDAIAAVNGAIDYADTKIKRNKVKWILIVFLFFISIVMFSFCTYKSVLLFKYKAPISNNYNELMSMLTLDEEIKIYKKPLENDKYFIDGDIKFRNDFSDYEKTFDSIAGSTRTVNYTKKDNVGNVVSSFTYGIYYQLIDAFSEDKVTFFCETDKDNKNFFSTESMFNSADRKYFLLKNDINDDVDLLKFVKKNYYLKSNIFSSKREIQENYAFNLFVDVVLPANKDSSTDIISGDYNGYMYKTNTDKGLVINANIIRNDKLYSFMFSGSNITYEYVIDFLSTLEIK